MVHGQGEYLFCYKEVENENFHPKSVLEGATEIIDINLFIYTHEMRERERESA